MGLLKVLLAFYIAFIYCACVFLIATVGVHKDKCLHHKTTHTHTASSWWPFMAFLSWCYRFIFLFSAQLLQEEEQQQQQVRKRGLLWKSGQHSKRVLFLGSDVSHFGRYPKIGYLGVLDQKLRGDINKIRLKNNRKFLEFPAPSLFWALFSVFVKLGVQLQCLLQ